MRYWIITWVVSTLSLLIAGAVVPGIKIRSIGPALLASLAIGFLNATLGTVLRFFGFPFTVMTFGLFLLLVSALMFWLASKMISGFEVSGFGAAFFGALVLTIVNYVLRYFVF